MVVRSVQSSHQPSPRTHHSYHTLPSHAYFSNNPPQVVGSVAHTLETVVRSVQSSPGEAYDAIRHILRLKAVGVPAAQGMDPVG